MSEAARTLSDADVEAIAEAVARRVGRKPASNDAEPEGPIRVTASDLEKLAARRARRGPTKRRGRR
jgi:hypothetical protein